MNDTSRINEQIKRMRTKGVEPEIINMTHDLWVQLGRPRAFSGVYCCVSDRVLGRFEVR